MTLVLLLAFSASVVLSGTCAVVALRSGWISVPAQSRRLGSLDGIRGYLALGVVLHHFAAWNLRLSESGWTPPTNTLRNAGQTAVAIFFMVSGALFYAYIRRAPRDVSWPALYISRFFRIVPLVTTATIVTIALELHRGGAFQQGDAWSIVLWCLGLSQRGILGVDAAWINVAGVFWTLKYEWGFYIMLPLVAALLQTATRRRTRVAALGLGVALITWLGSFLEIGNVEPQFFILFLVGMIVYELSLVPLIREALRTPYLAALAAVALSLQMTTLGPIFSDGLETSSLALLAFFFMPVIAGNSFGGLLRLKASLALSELSFGIYVLHGIVLSVANQDTGLGGVIQDRPVLGTALLLPLYAVVTTALAVVANRFVERPAIAVGKAAGVWLSRWPQSRAA